MTMTDTQQRLLATQLNAVVDFCLKHKGNATLTKTRESLFRYVAFSFFSGKMAVSWEDNQIQAVVFYWSEVFEILEMKHAEGRFMFEWQNNVNGDCLFVGDVIGTRKAVGKLWQATLEKYPHLIVTPIYTLRRDKLVKLSHKLLNRFAP